MPNVRVAGAELHYERAGSGEPLLAIQGMSGTHMSWGSPFRSLLEQHFDCIVFDNRGIGLSPRITEPFTIAEMAADSAQLLDALEVESAHVLGISMGGMIAQELALAHPERLRSLTIGCSYCGGPGSQLMDPADFQGLAEAMASGSQDRVFRAMYELNLSPAFRTEEDRYAEFTAMAEALPVAQRTVQLQLQAITGHDTSARLPGLATPTLVVHGTVDRVLGYPNGPLIAALIPGARLEPLEDVGHMFWWEQPEGAAELVREHALASA
ncbi:MAG: alpha/beta fold hydrolase [Solirubrobacterales bacterium]|nr:alpha/beta fold hydrolase [Solirubrobacterales bacterium]